MTKWRKALFSRWENTTIYNINYSGMKISQSKNTYKLNRFWFKICLYNCNFKPYVSYNHTLHSSSGNTDQFTEAWTLLQTSLTIIGHVIWSDCELVDVYGDSLCRLLTLHVYHYLSSVSKIFRIWSVYVRFHLDVIMHWDQPFWKAHISHLDMCRTMAFSIERNPYIQFINGVVANFDLCCLRFRRIISISSIFQELAKDNKYPYQVNILL